MQILKKIENELIIFVFLTVKLIFMYRLWSLGLPIFVSLLFFAFFSFVFGKILRQTVGEEKKIFTTLMALFLSSAVPNMVFSPQNLATPNMVYKNILFVTCLIISAVFLDGKESKWRIPLFCLLCTALDPLFALLFFPTIALMLFYRLGSKKASKDYLYILLLSLPALALGFAISFLLGHTAWLLASVSWLGLLANAVRVLPLIVFFALIWFRALQKTQNRHLKLTIILTIFASILPLSALFLQSNYTNPLMVAIFSQFVILAILLIKDDEFYPVLYESTSFLHQKPFLVLLTLIYLSAFSIYRFNSMIQNWFLRS